MYVRLGLFNIHSIYIEKSALHLKFQVANRQEKIHRPTLIVIKLL